ncbi:MAG: NlpC/P60 family N-terminal domain-containing protein, partial [Desulfovibrionaceae bacterium]|nr:NlpC/P60 family N-terminal domain-containing protein [Desulfovibrionaceae bacterium]
MRRFLPRALGLVLCLVLLTACGAKKPQVYRGMQDIEDLQRFPQDLTAYLDDSRDRPILTQAEAAEHLAKWRSSFFSAWHM